MGNGKQQTSRPSAGKLPAPAGTIDLGSLCLMHPRLPPDMAAVMVLRAALGLQRNRHASGARVDLEIERVRMEGVLRWPLADLNALAQHDAKRVTEDGAEAIALAFAHQLCTWNVVRRMQQEEHGDWLLEHSDRGTRRLVAFEVSGTDRALDARLMKEKLQQVARSEDVDRRCAGIVGFRRPEAALLSL